MSQFTAAMNDAFKRLAIQEACPKHVWCAPFEQNYGYAKERKTMWSVRCKLCHAQSSRDTLEQLQTEVLDS